MTHDPVIMCMPKRVAPAAFAFRYASMIWYGATPNLASGPPANGEHRCKLTIRAVDGQGSGKWTEGPVSLAPASGSQKHLSVHPPSTLLFVSLSVRPSPGFNRKEISSEHFPRASTSASTREMSSRLMTTP